MLMSCGDEVLELIGEGETLNPFALWSGLTLDASVVSVWALLREDEGLELPIDDSTDR